MFILLLLYVFISTTISTLHNVHLSSINKLIPVNKVIELIPGSSILIKLTELVPTTTYELRLSYPGSVLILFLFIYHFNIGSHGFSNIEK